MKKLVLIICFLAISALGFAQVMVDNVDINNLDIKYVELVAVQKFMSKKVAIRVDYGQQGNITPNQSIKDKDGKNHAFESVVDALNFMDKNGWDFISNFIVTESNQNVYHYLLKKKT